MGVAIAVSKPMPHLTPEAIDVSWEIIQAANRAFDTLREAEANINEVEELSLKVEGVELWNGALAPLEKIRNDAQANFRLLVEMAAPVMSFSVSPFAIRPTEIADVGAMRLVEEFAEPLEGLSADYRECLITRYALIREAVARQINDGTLPVSYELPELSALLARAASLASTYETMAKNNWQPEVVFVPRGLSFDHWNALLSGHRLPDQSWTEGVHRTWAGFELARTVTADTDASPWGVAVISAAERPVFASVSKDGEHGFNAADTLRALATLPSVVDASSASEVIRRASPTEERYLALQFARLERGEQPVDCETWTIGNEDLDIGGQLGSLYFYFRPKEHKFKSIWRSRDAFDNNDGVRPSAGDEDVVANV